MATLLASLNLIQASPIHHLHCYHLIFQNNKIANHLAFISVLIYLHISPYFQRVGSLGEDVPTKGPTSCLKTIVRPFSQETR